MKFLKDNKGLGYELQEIVDEIKLSSSDIDLDKSALNSKDIYEAIKIGNMATLFCQCCSKKTGIDLTKVVAKYALLEMPTNKEQYIIAFILAALANEREISIKKYKDIIYFSVI